MLAPAAALRSAGPCPHVLPPLDTKRSSAQRPVEVVTTCGYSPQRRWTAYPKKTNLIFLNWLSICIIKRGNNFNSMQMGMGLWGCSSHLPIPWSPLWPHFPISVTDIITGDPRKIKVLIWGGVGSNKKKAKDCPELSTEADWCGTPSGPWGRGSSHTVTVPKSFIFRNWMIESLFRYCKVCRYCRNHCGQRKIKVIGTGEEWNKLRQTGSYHY